MSTRYAVVLIPDPAFTALVYRARQLICGQYASWAAEMHMLHLALTDYFPCPEDAVESVTTGLGRVAEEHRRDRGVLILAHQGIAAFPELPGHIFLDFTVPAGASDGEERNLWALRKAILELLEQVTGGMVGPQPHNDDLQPRIYLMQHADLPLSTFNSAIEFARVVTRQLAVPERTQGWQLMLVRFQSAAAGEDWSNGRWAADLSWQIVSSHQL